MPQSKEKDEPPPPRSGFEALPQPSTPPPEWLLLLLLERAAPGGKNVCMPLHELTDGGLHGGDAGNSGDDRCAGCGGGMAVVAATMAAAPVDFFFSVQACSSGAASAADSTPGCSGSTAIGQGAQRASAAHKEEAESQRD